MTEQLIKLIEELQKSVSETALLFEKYKGVSQNDLARSRFESLGKNGYLDAERLIEYKFHGIGLCVNYPNRTIDWDFGYNGRLDGFDLWRLWIFATEGTDNFSDFKEKSILEKAFQEAIAEGKIHQKFKEFQDDLYYLSTIR